MQQNFPVLSSHFLHSRSMASIPRFLHKNYHGINLCIRLRRGGHLRRQLVRVFWHFFEVLLHGVDRAVSFPKYNRLGSQNLTAIVPSEENMLWIVA